MVGSVDEAHERPEHAADDAIERTLPNRCGRDGVDHDLAHPPTLRATVCAARHIDVRRRPPRWWSIGAMSMDDTADGELIELEDSGVRVFVRRARPSWSRHRLGAAPARRRRHRACRPTMSSSCTRAGCAARGTAGRWSPYPLTRVGWRVVRRRGDLGRRDRGRGRHPASARCRHRVRGRRLRRGDRRGRLPRERARGARRASTPRGARSCAPRCGRASRRSCAPWATPTFIEPSRLAAVDRRATTTASAASSAACPSSGSAWRAGPLPRRAGARQSRGVGRRPRLIGRHGRRRDRRADG